MATVSNRLLSCHQAGHIRRTSKLSNGISRRSFRVMGLSYVIRPHILGYVQFKHLQTVVNLAEQHGKEAQVTNAYRDFVNELNCKNIQ